MPIYTYSNKPYYGASNNAPVWNTPWSPFDSSMGHIANVGYEPDSFKANTPKINKENKKEGFTLDKGVSSFFKGFTQPIVEMLKHPVQTLGIAAGLGYLIKKVPRAGKFAAIAGLAVGAYQFLSGFGKTISGISSGNAKQAEEGCESMGTGTFSALMTYGGARSSNRGIRAFLRRRMTGIHDLLFGKDPRLAAAGENAAENNVGLLTRVKNRIFGKRTDEPTPNDPITGNPDEELIPNDCRTLKERARGFYEENINGEKIAKTGKSVARSIPKGLRYEAPFMPYLAGGNEGYSKTENAESSSAESEQGESGEKGSEELTVFKIGDNAIKRIS